ncbi:Dentin sialophosphoprotein-related, putative isoform 2 [Hibiscus syriacus]|uniref:Dentin sialophosphoprotein-related, putative isoform 2 n=1 Tax=Hibiscus syriacus TaxID=106335 RepID=A0A6A3A2N4_HIBSY|nr:protein LNK1-like [Hibiscus syriacus]XP_039006768.1 protein LNK1-like [Hibiscus syriacus]KAE8698531.1 Dentin sialophosphoprotein-related, putative isoform 2 [Hibiscus syriacus]
MSDFMYELEDNVWPEFSASATDDHIVPHAVGEYRVQFKVQGDGQTKPRHEVTRVASNADNTIKYGIFGDKEKGFHTLNNNRMLEKGPWSDKPVGIFPTSDDNDSLKEVTSMVSDDQMMSSHGLKTGDIDSVSSDFCSDDPVLVDNCATEDNNIYSFPLNHISEANEDLRFFNNNHEDKENSDLLCYGWGDIGNFEDVDRMFRNCDSTFGLGSLSNEDDLHWVSSSQATEGSHNVLKADAKLNSLPENCTTSSPDADPSTIDSNKKSVLISDKISSLGMSSRNSGLAHMSSLNVSNNESGSKDDLTPNEQISPQIKQSKQLSASGERTDHHIKNGGFYNQIGNTKQFVDVKHPSSDAPCQLFSPLDLQWNKRNSEPDSVSCVQTNGPFMHLNFSSSSNQVSRCPTLTSSKSEKKGHPFSTNGSSYASNQAQSIDRGHSFEVPDIIMNEKVGKLYHQQDTQAPVNRIVDQARVERQIVVSDTVIAQKQVCQSEWDEGHSVGKQAELGSSNGQESSCVSLDEVSPETTSFRQLQQVMEKLDIRTKLCIRDSLYRLAWSAEQRHNCTNTNSGSRDYKDASRSLETEESSKCTRYMDMETDTNPIDRSIAHLLFHRPSDPSLRPDIKTASLKSHGMIHGSTTAQPVMSKKHIGQDETDEKSLS